MTKEKLRELAKKFLLEQDNSDWTEWYSTERKRWQYAINDFLRFIGNIEEITEEEIGIEE